MISVLCPTRNRQLAFSLSIESLRRTHNPIEVLAYVDDDDERRPFFGAADVIITGPRVGYAGMHEMVNTLAKAATGDWLLLWNDDAFMQTPGWDIDVERSRPAVLNPATNHGPGLVPFPIVPRAWVDTLGHFSLNRHCDSWWQEIGARLDRLDDIAVDVFHDRADLTGNNNDATYQQRAYDPDFYGPETTARIDADAERLRAVL